MAWGLCERCGLRFLLAELDFDGYFPNLRVCDGCYDPPQPQERLVDVTDPEALYKPSPDTVYLSPPVLVVSVVGSSSVLSWSGFNKISQAMTDEILPADQGKRPLGSSSGANITAGYYVNRSSDGITFAVIATLMNTADEFGALVVETNTYTDTPGAGTWYYSITGFDSVDAPGVQHE